MRLFAAIEIPTEIKRRLDAAVAPLRPLAKLSWSPVENLHVTTKFIGEWPEERLQTLKDSLKLADSGQRTADSEIAIAVRRLGWFPNERNPRVLWAGIEAGPDLAKLAKDTEAALGTIGVPTEDREYHPHLTLARRRNPVPIERLRKAMEALPDTDFGVFRATSFFLYLSAAGKYTKLQEYPLC